MVPVKENQMEPQKVVLRGGAKDIEIKKGQLKALRMAPLKACLKGNQKGLQTQNLWDDLIQ